MVHLHVHVGDDVYMFFNERPEGREKDASKVKQTNKAKQPMTLYTCTYTIYMCVHVPQDFKYGDYAHNTIAISATADQILDPVMPLHQVIGDRSTVYPLLAPT